MSDRGTPYDRIAGSSDWPAACPYCSLQDHTGREHFQFAMSLNGGSTPNPPEATDENAPGGQS